MAQFCLFLFALHLSAQSAGAQVPGCIVPEQIEELRAEHVLALNRLRAREGQPALKRNALLDKVAQAYACLLSHTDHFDHTGPDGSSPGDRIAAGGYKACGYGENLAKGQTSFSAAMVGWINSPGHWENLVRPWLREIGFGVAAVDMPGAGGGGMPGGGVRPGPGLADLAEELSPDSHVAADDRDPLTHLHAPMVWVQVFGTPCH